jgi:hypothetical protein
VGKVTGDAHAGGLRFRLRDVKGSATVPVLYRGSVPDLKTRIGRCATNRATKLREPGRTESTGERLNKPQRHQRTSFRRYRTQEVAGSSPASSMAEACFRWKLQATTLRSMRTSACDA